MVSFISYKNTENKKDYISLYMNKQVENLSPYANINNHRFLEECIL